MDGMRVISNKLRKDTEKNYYLIFPIIMCIVWVLVLYRTEGYYSVYIVCAILGVFSILSRLSEKNMASSSGKILEKIVAYFLAVCVATANYKYMTFATIFEGVQSIIWLILLLVSGFYVFYNIILCFEIIWSKYSWQNEKEVGNPYKSAIIVFLVIVCIDILYLFGHVFPGTLTADSIWQLEQAKNASYYNHHPFWHTYIIRICLKIGRRLFGTMNGGVVVYSLLQIMLMAFAFSYAYFTIHQMKVKKWIRRLIIIGYECMPFHIAYSATMWKDVFFAGFVLIYVVALIRIIYHIGETKWNYFFFTIGTIGFVLFRSNGGIALALTLILFMFFIKYLKECKKLIFIMLIVLLTVKAINIPVFRYFNVTETSITEALSIPLQQIARVVVDGGTIEDKEREMLEVIIDIDKIPSLYMDSVSDPIKIAVREKGNEQYIIDNKMDFLIMWMKIGLKNPCSYITAWVDQTKGYWDGGYVTYIWSTDLKKNDMGICREKFIEQISPLWHAYSNAYKQNPILQPFLSVGMYVWILLMLGVVALRIQKIKLLPIIPIVAVWMTLLIATPVCGDFRYIYSLFTCLPIILVAVFYKNDILPQAS